ncbi:probable alpha-1,6-mannosyltransferase MNN10 [Phoenix dactylifera]|uniref:Probable alpha-1,6-mannosyltransferase MNN10 n=1 Tax=Phoenix dactylifera TaxID=42345 RepID=A0A8B8J690_PHODC|nr:probable alpha-1,6-mannosyltransferase MNN10 [Phoenix dactylifera]
MQRMNLQKASKPRSLSSLQLEFSPRKPPMAPRPRVRWTKTRHANRRLWLLLCVASPLLALATLHAAAAALRRANAFGRRCAPDAVEYSGEAAAGFRPRIAMVTFSAEEIGGGSRRSFRGVMEAVGENKRAYAGRMGYDFIDAGGLVDPSRPPSWSKIPAVRSQLPNYDWVFWNDADTVITNPDISLENILNAAIGHSDLRASPDLVVTEDFNGVNAGVFFFRRSEWSEKFLDTWWNQTSFVLFGSTISGDNTALKHLINGLPSEELQDHVRTVPMQCLFNSYPWLPIWKNAYRLIFSPLKTWEGAYSDGDFMVHLAGLDEKKKWAARILGELRA